MIKKNMAQKRSALIGHWAKTQKILSLSVPNCILFIYSIMHFKHKINGKVNKMNSKHIIREMAKPVGLKHAV